METPLGIVPALIPNVWWVPELAASLLSVAFFTDHSKHDILFNNDDCFIHSKPSGKCVASAHKTSESLYHLIAHPIISKEYANTAINSHHLDINLLHQPLLIPQSRTVLPKS